MATIKELLALDIQTDVKPFIKVEYNDDKTIQTITDGVLTAVQNELSRTFEDGDDELDHIKLIVLQAIAYFYDNRGDTKLPQHVLEAINKYAFVPGF